MKLLYKPDWEEAKQRYRAWWAHESMDRCASPCVRRRTMFCRRSRRRPRRTPWQRWTDLDYLSRDNEYWMSRTFFGGEAFPCWNGGYPGHTAIPAFLGCPTQLDMTTGWWDPILTGEDLAS